MKALTVRNPWAWAIIYGGKDVENRSTNTSHLGPLAIHTAKAVDTDAMRSPLVMDAIDEYNAQPVIPGQLINRADLEQFGNIIGIVNLNPPHPAEYCRRPDGSLCSPWAMDDKWHWPLVNPRPLNTPVRTKGALGLWEWDPYAYELIDSSAAQEHVQEYTLIPYAFFCSCGAMSAGTEDDPALFEDHLRSVGL